MFIIIYHYITTNSIYRAEVIVSFHYIHENQFDDDGQRHFIIYTKSERPIMGGDLRGRIFLDS